MPPIRKLHHSLWLVFLVPSLFYLLTQLEHLYLHVGQAPKQSFSLLQEMGFLFFGQGQNLLIGGGLALGFYGIRKRKIARIFYVGVLWFILMYLAVNHLFYAQFFDHIQLGMTQGEANLSRIWSSFLAELNGWFALNVLVASLAGFYLGYQLILRQEFIGGRSDGLQHKIAIGLLGCWTVISLWFTHTYDNNRNWSNHPFTTLTISFFSSEKPTDEIRHENPINEDIYTLRYGKAPIDTAFEKQILTNYPQQNRPSAPNVIYIILESVGAKNIFSPPSFLQLDSTLTPNLYRWNQHLIEFPTLYNIYPSTTSSHFTIQTGGYTDMTKSINSVAEFPFIQATLTGIFKNRGYETGLFSSMLFYTMDNWYRQMPFDVKFIPDQLSEKELKESRLAAWGIREEIAIDRCVEWLSNRSSNSPFFLQLITSATHHPYTAPSEYPNPFGTTNNASLYRNTLHYTDAQLGKLFRYLEDNNLLTNTIVAISGDHGQAFGDIHAQNLIHGGQVYEENIRNFLLLYDFQKPLGKWISQKQGFIGDIMPTLLSYTRDSTQLLGQNLLEENYQPKIRYLRKGLPLHKWGLVDGQWKYITERGNPSKSELYNLQTDPSEQYNIAAQYPNRMKEYYELCNDWYIIEGKRFDNQWIDLDANPELNIEVTADKPIGIKSLRFGIVENPEGKFVELPRIRPTQDFVAYTVGFPYTEDTVIEYEWKAPNGELYTFNQTHPKSKWKKAVVCPIDRPLMLGNWSLTLREKATGKKILHNSFIVQLKKERF